jgi:hypothetical protein
MIRVIAAVEKIRRQLAEHGVTVRDLDVPIEDIDTTVSETGESELLEPFAVLRVERTGETMFTDFVDGVQTVRAVFRWGGAPCYYARAVAVRLTRDATRRLRREAHDSQEWFMTPFALYTDESIPILHELGFVDVDGEAGANSFVSTARNTMERRLARESAAWCVVDGSCADIKNPLVVGVSKKVGMHLPIETMRTVLNMQVGERTTAFRLPTEPGTVSFYMRLFDRRGDTPHFGLVRVTVAENAPEPIERIAEWLMVETRPLATDNHNVLYPMEVVERHANAL